MGKVFKEFQKYIRLFQFPSELRNVTNMYLKLITIAHASTLDVCCRGRVKMANKDCFNITE